MKNECFGCPRNCGAKRPLGVCHSPEEFLVSRIALHPYEEPVISGNKGSGTVFFGGCNLGCVFCQNKEISRGGKGQIITDDELKREIFSLVEKGAHNINFVTPSHYATRLAKFLEGVKAEIPVPIVYNSSGYDKIESLKALDGLVDVYMPDLKYFSSELSAKYSKAHDYFEVAKKAILEMHRQCPKSVYGEDGLLKKGVIVRHLVLPSHKKDSENVLNALAKMLPPSDILLSLMSQYTPEFCDDGYPELKRRLTSFEYSYVSKIALSLGFDGFFQERSSATKEYTPEF